MDIFTALADDLRSITSDLDEPAPDLQTLLRGLVDDTRLVVRSYLGLSLTLFVQGQPVTLTLLEDFADPGDIAASLLLPLTAVTDVEAGGALIFYAARPGAFVDFAADFSYALHIALDAIVLDDNLSPPATGSGLAGADEVSDVNQALGILLGRGQTLLSAHRELRGRAQRGGTTLPLAARELIRAAVDAARPHLAHSDPVLGSA
jgi:hypothetical protein